MGGRCEAAMGARRLGDCDGRVAAMMGVATRLVREMDGRVATMGGRWCDW
jgi:hypothetical protein